MAGHGEIRTHLLRRGASKRCRTARSRLLAAAAAATAASTLTAAVRCKPWTQTAFSSIGPAGLQAGDASDAARQGHAHDHARDVRAMADGPRPQARRAVVGATWTGLMGLVASFARAGSARADDLEDMLGEVQADTNAASNKPRKKVTGPAHDQVAEAAESLHSLQKNWAEIEKQGATGAGRVLDEISGALNRAVVVEVPAGQQAGVEVDACRVTKVYRKELGWRTGDRVEFVNDVEVMDQEALQAATKELRDKGQPIKYTLNRMSTSPFITLERALNKVYGDADASTVLPDPGDVAKMFREFKFDIELARDGFGDFAEIRKKLDAYSVEVDKFANA